MTGSPDELAVQPATPRRSARGSHARTPCTTPTQLSSEPLPGTPRASRRRGRSEVGRAQRAQVVPAQHQGERSSPCDGRRGSFLYHHTLFPNFDHDRGGRPRVNVSASPGRTPVEPPGTARAARPAGPRRPASGGGPDAVIEQAKGIVAPCQRRPRRPRGRWAEAWARSVEGRRAYSARDGAAVVAVVLRQVAATTSLGTTTCGDRCRRGQEDVRRHRGCQQFPLAMPLVRSTSAANCAI